MHFLFRNSLKQLIAGAVVFTFFVTQGFFLPRFSEAARPQSTMEQGEKGKREVEKIAEAITQLFRESLRSGQALSPAIEKKLRQPSSSSSTKIPPKGETTNGIENMNQFKEEIAALAQAGIREAGVEGRSLGDEVNEKLTAISNALVIGGWIAILSFFGSHVPEWFVSDASQLPSFLKADVLSIFISGFSTALIAYWGIRKLQVLTNDFEETRLGRREAEKNARALAADLKEAKLGRQEAEENARAAEEEVLRGEEIVETAEERIQVAAERAQKAEKEAALLSILGNILTAVSSQENVEGMYRVVVDQVMELLDCDRAGINLWTESEKYDSKTGAKETFALVDYQHYRAEAYDSGDFRSGMKIREGEDRLTSRALARWRLHRDQDQLLIEDYRPGAVEYAAQPSKGAREAKITFSISFPIFSGDEMKGNVIFSTTDSDYVLKKEVIDTVRQLIGVLSILIQRKEAEGRALEQMKHERAVIGSMKYVPCIVGMNGVIHFVGPQIENYGFYPEKLVSQPLFRLIHQDDRVRIEERLAQLVMTEKGTSTEFRLINSKDRSYWFEARANVIQTSKRKTMTTTGILLMLRDITDQKTAEDRESKRGPASEGASAHSLGQAGVQIPAPQAAKSQIYFDSLVQIKNPVVVLIDFKEIQGFSLGQMDEINKLSGHNLKNLRVIFYGAPQGGERPPELFDFPNIAFTDQDALNIPPSFFPSKSERIHLSRFQAPPPGITANRFRYPDDQNGLLGAAILYVQAADKQIAANGLGLQKDDQGFFSKIDQAIQKIIQDQESSLVISKAA